MHIKLLRTISLILLIIAMCTACSTQPQQQKQEAQQEQTNHSADELLVSAAASLTIVLDNIITSFEEQYGIDVAVNYASSGTLQKQIEQGAPVDVFISAGSKQMELLAEKRLVEEVKPLLRNSLVVVSASELNRPYHSLEELLTAVNAKHIAVGQPDIVPAGYYTQQALDTEQLWSAWNHTYVYGKDVRQVLSYVEQGNAELGFVYYTDALSSAGVQIVYTIPEELHEPIEYPIAVVAASKQRNVAQQFLSFIQQGEWREHYERNGFRVE